MGQTLTRTDPGLASENRKKKMIQKPLQPLLAFSLSFSAARYIREGCWLVLGKTGVLFLRLWPQKGNWIFGRNWKEAGLGRDRNMQCLLIKRQGDRKKRPRV